MKYAKLEQIARGLSPEEQAADLKSLANDNRFAAVVRLLIDQKDVASDNSCQLKFAEHHGLLAHAAGVRYGMLEMESRIKQACEPPKKTGPQPPVQ